MIEPLEVAAAHDSMGAEYDSIDDLWYTFLFNRIHRFIVEHLDRSITGTALDVGCGTGFQSFLLCQAGYHVTGFDLSPVLVELAKAKAERVSRGEPISALFTSSLTEMMAYQQRLLDRAAALRGERPPSVPEFRVGDAALRSSYEGGPFDVMVCCGSVLSFIDEHESVLRYMAEALKPGGILFLEVEQKVNMDLVWSVFDSVLRGRLGYAISFRESMRNLLSHPGGNIRVDYPFPLSDGKEVVLPLWIFSIKYLRNAFASCRLQVMKRMSVHALTNLIPSTVLHRQEPGKCIKVAFALLARAEECVAGWWPFWRLGCSVVYCLRKAN